jgi:phosphomevalonate kinase
VKVRAPGKLVLTGAYAVLEGAPAIVLAVGRHAVADGSRVEPTPSAEVREALGTAPAPFVDARGLFDESGKKLGLGSSAAVLVASLGAVAAREGKDIASDPVRQELFRVARAAHSRTQQGGSGIDVAASVFGGVLRYELLGDERRPVMRHVKLPSGTHFAVYWSGSSVRTSDLRARVDALAAKDRPLYDARLRALSTSSAAAAQAVDSNDAAAFVAAAQAVGVALEALGNAADAPIFTPAMLSLAHEAWSAGVAFLPSGAGGGDVAVHLGKRLPPPAFDEAARRLGMTRLDVDLDLLGVRTLDERMEH